jgi:hypothetical protein
MNWNFNQIWYGASSASAAAAGIASIIHGYTTMGVVLFAIGLAEFAVAAYVFKIFKTK